MAEMGVEVVIQIGGEDVVAGRMWSHRRRRTESASFSYAPSYLARSDAYELDPQLPLSEGQQQTLGDRAMFGAFSDTSPDRWGRRLIHRDEQRRARREGRTEHGFGEIDYLLGVRDDLRQGALRFRDPGTGAYFAPEDTGVRSLLELPAVLNAADKLERDEASDDELRTLLNGGSSLGGVRPKAHVLGSDGKLAIAKFPSPANDDWDVMRWEAVALQLADDAGISVPGRHLHEIDGKAVLIVNRFDRAGEQRVGYVSAMTLLQATDHDQASYLEIAEAIESNSTRTSADLRELWRRMAFSILISNTDDHLRNHGFLRTSSAGWTLSPAFDLNPQPGPGPKSLATAIDLESTAARVETLMEVAGEFRLNHEDASATLNEVLAATSQWRVIAQRLGLDRAAIDEMASAFEHDQAERARQVVEASSGREAPAESRRHR